MARRYEIDLGRPGPEWRPHRELPPAVIKAHQEAEHARECGIAKIVRFRPDDHIGPVDEDGRHKKRQQPFDGEIVERFHRMRCKCMPKQINAQRDRGNNDAKFDRLGEKFHGWIIPLR